MKATTLITALSVLVTAFAFGALGLAVGQGLGRSEQTNSEAHVSCVAVNRLQAVIVQQLERGKINLPKIDYYKHHPVELAHQLAEIDREIAAFQPHDCP